MTSNRFAWKERSIEYGREARYRLCRGQRLRGRATLGGRTNARHADSRRVLAHKHDRHDCSRTSRSDALAVVLEAREEEAGGGDYAEDDVRPVGEEGHQNRRQE